MFTGRPLKLPKHFRETGNFKTSGSNKGTVNTRPDKENCLVILGKTFHEGKISKLISDVNKFEKLDEDPKLYFTGCLGYPTPVPRPSAL